MKPRLLAAHLIFVSIAASATAQQAPEVVNKWPLVEAGEQATSPNNHEITKIARVGGEVHVFFRVRPAAPNAACDDGVSSTPCVWTTYARSLDLATGVLGPRRQVWQDSYSENDTYHTEPTFFALGGVLRGLFPCAGGNYWQNPYPAPTANWGGDCAVLNSIPTAEGLPPRLLLMPDLADPNTWSGNGPEYFMLPKRPGAATLAAQATIFDVHASIDPGDATHEAIAHLSSEGAYFENLDGPSQPSPGLPRTYYRVTESGSYDGPYILVSGANLPPDASGNYCNGNVFAKGELQVGPGPTSPRRVHLFWTIRHTFREKTAGVCDSNKWVQIERDMFYAYSDDGGTTWRSSDGAASSTLPARLPWDGGSQVAHWRIYAGNVDQNTERAATVDRQGRPMVVLKKHRPGTGQLFDIGGVLMPDSDGSAPVPTYDFALLRWSGTSWVETPIDSEWNWFAYRPEIRVDELDRIWVFAPTSVSGVHQSAYRRSADSGATWTAWTPVAGQYSAATYVVSQPDPVNPNNHYLVVSGNGFGESVLISMRLTPDGDDDGVTDSQDNCPATSNSSQADADVDQAGDACDVCPNDPNDDEDADGVCGDVDNCPAIANPTQADADGDQVGDACDCLTTNSGLRSPTAQQATSGGDGNGFEGTPTNAFADANGRADNVNGPGDRHIFYNYGINVPAFCQVTGIQVRLDWWLDGTNGTNSMSAELSWDGGASWSAMRTDTQETTSQHTGILGSSSDTWGRAWTAADLANGNFRVRLTSNGTNSGRDYRLDWVPVRVWWAQ